MNVTSAVPAGINVTDRHNQSESIFKAEMDKWRARALMTYRVVYPVIVIVGTLGNIMTILVLRKMLSDQSGFPLLFMALAITDLLILYVWVLPEWVSFQSTVYLSDTNYEFCRAYVWLWCVLQSLSAWLLAAMTVQRALTIVCPLWMRRARPRRQAVVIIALLVVAALVGNFVPIYVQDGSTYGICEERVESEQNIELTLRVAANAALPLAVIVVCNSLMIRAVVRSSKKRTQQGTASRENSATSRLTLTLISVSVAFFLLTTPFYVMYIVWFRIWETAEREQWPSLIPITFVLELSRMMVAANSAVNFFLYVLTGTKFREEVKSMLGTVMVICGKKHRTGQPEETTPKPEQS